MNSARYLSLVAVLLTSTAASGRAISLSGEWRFRLDRAHAGIGEQWFKSSLPDRVPLPGSTDEHGRGVQNNRVEPRRLTRAWEYVGPAWYQRDIDIPPDWKGLRVTLFLERCHWETQLWLDDKHIGLQNSLSTPQIHDLGTAASPGRHRLTIRVDNRLKIDVGPWASGITEEGPGNWNGIAGRIELSATEPVWIDSVRVFPDAANGTARFEIRVRNLTSTARTLELSLAASQRGAPSNRVEITKRVDIPAKPTTIIEETVTFRPPARWSGEFSPSLYDATVALGSEPVHTTFGIRDWTRMGTQFALNGRALLLRGNVDNGAFPLKGYPPMDTAAWRERLQVYRDYGFNHVRFHSWCPPEAAFAAADELGLLFQVENPMWIGDGRVSADSARTAFIRAEAERIVDTYGNHPSFALMSMGNELGGGLDPFLAGLVESLRHRDPRHFYTSTTAPDNVVRPDDYFVSAGPGWQHLRGDPRLERKPPDTDFDYREYLAKLDRPTIAHELGQWTVFPDLNEGRKYTGSQQPRYLEIYRESVVRNHIADQVEDFRRASGAHMVGLYKEEIESILRTPGIAGFQLLALADWPGFGPAFIGILDALNESRGLITPAAYRRFSSPTVPLLRMTKRTWTTAETFAGDVSVAHFGDGPLPGGVASWVIRNQAGQTVASGRLPCSAITQAGLHPVGSFRAPLAAFKSPGEYTVEVSVGGFANDWRFWVYPEQVPPTRTDRLLVTGAWDAATRSALRDGGRVLLMARAGRLENTIPVSFTTSFWSPLWFPKRPETMGILCDPAHPALASFATRSHSDWQWWDLMSGARALVLDSAPAAFRPVVQVIDDPTRNHKLGAVFEARVGNGKILVTTFDLESALETRLGARQLRHSLSSYAASDNFDPKAELSLDFLDELFAQTKRP